MPEGPEVETESLHETIHEQLEEHGGTFLKRIALTTALFAAFAAVAALRAGATVNHALVLKTEAARSAYLAIAKDPPADFARKEKRYAAEQTDIEKEARKKEKERDEKSNEADELLHHHHGFANSVALFQVSIALGAVAALTRIRMVWWGSLLLGGAATILLTITQFRG